MIKFDWTGFNEEDMREANECRIEDDIFGAILAEFNDDAYLIDIHHTYYSSRDKYFDLEVYGPSNEEPFYGIHGKWLGSVQEIKTATNYKRFCKRAEDYIIKFLRDYRIKDGKYDTTT